MRTNTAAAIKAARKQATAHKAPKPPAREPKNVTDDLKHHSRDLGIPVDELSRICLRAGVDQLNAGELKVREVGRTMVSLDLSKAFKCSEIMSIDRECKRRKITREELISAAIIKGLQDFRISEADASDAAAGKGGEE
jgi:hypothetical protein